MRRLAIAIVVTSSWPMVLRAQELSLERISIALQQPAPVFGTTPVPTDPPRVSRKLGPLTLVQPEIMRGEFVRVSLPVGELVSRAVDHIRTAALRREEAAARREVDAALKAFLDAQPPER
ncbi:MAG TPA: hypothetical protein VL263_13595 [Vicinamibacterales bacterium]|jgi:hypothetical protein|nr:hypothetical protein [Vicinamibacterales bacterium]